jgi:hypothetical protein
MDVFEELGRTVHGMWRRADFDNRAFPEIACDTLHSLALQGRITCDDVIDWVAEATVLPTQTDLEAAFGEPPVVVYWDSRFYIEVLFWTTGTTAVHQHSFSGAFTVLSGSSVQSQYQFINRERVNEHMLFGDLQLQRCGILARGDIEPIYPGDGLIHSVFHLEMPSVSVVVRTHRDAETSVQHKYFRPHLAVDPFFTNAETTRRLQILDLLGRLNSPRYENVACGMLERADCLETFELLNRCRPQRDKAPAVFERFINAARARHGARIDMMLPVFDEMDREAVLVTRREQILDRDHRFLLALLINLPNRKSILSMVRERYSGDPEQLVMKWVSELSGKDVLGIELDPLNASILRCLIAGLSFEAMCDRLRQEYSSEDIAAQRDALENHCERIKRLAVFRTLLNVEPAA